MKTVLLSAGHSTVPPKDSGAVGNGFVEAQEALKVRDAVAAFLRAKRPDLNVIEDGADGVSEPLKKAIALARTANVAVEFHFNAGPPTATGVECLSKPHLKGLAQKIAQAIAKPTGLTIRGDGGWKADNSGQHHRLGFCEAGGIIAEVAFISNNVDMARYSQNFPAMCEGIAEAISRDLGAFGGTVVAEHGDAPKSRDLKLGDSGADVKELQTVLHYRAFLAARDVDGDFGAITKKAVIAFQTSQNLQPDGIVGQNTRKALNLG